MLIRGLESRSHSIKLPLLSSLLNHTARTLLTAALRAWGTDYYADTLRVSAVKSEKIGYIR